MKQTIAVPYNPDDVLNEWGWLWEDDPEGDEGTWMLVATSEDDDGALMTEVWDADGMSNEARGEWDAETLRGQPYLPMIRPGCDPKAGHWVGVYLPGGASIAHSIDEPGEYADEARSAALAAININPGRERRE